MVVDIEKSLFGSRRVKLQCVLHRTLGGASATPTLGSQRNKLRVLAI